MSVWVEITDTPPVYMRYRGGGERGGYDLKSVRLFILFVYYESIKRELNKRLIFDSRCDARLKGKPEGCTRVA